jgi:hypothetical protein
MAPSRSGPLVAFLMTLTDESFLHDARLSNPFPKP